MFKRGLVGAFILFPLFVSCGKDDFLTKANSDFTQAGVKLQKVGENVGRIPRILGNAILGTDADSDENITDLEKEVDKLYQQFLSSYTYLLQEFARFEVDSEEKNEAYEALNEALEALTDKVNGMDSKNAQDILELNEDVIALYQKLVCAKSANGLNAVKNCF